MTSWIPPLDRSSLASFARPAPSLINFYQREDEEYWREAPKASEEAIYCSERF